MLTILTHAPALPTSPTAPPPSTYIVRRQEGHGCRLELVGERDDTQWSRSASKQREAVPSLPSDASRVVTAAPASHHAISTLAAAWRPPGACPGLLTHPPPGHERLSTRSITFRRAAPARDLLTWLRCCSFLRLCRSSAERAVPPPGDAARAQTDIRGWCTAQWYCIDPRRADLLPALRHG